MNVLQLGSTNWAKEYSIPDDVKWSFNSYDKKIKYFDLVIITGGVSADTIDWRKLQWMIEPYRVLYTKEVLGTLNKEATRFLKLQMATEINEDVQTLIDSLLSKYFSDQGGIRLKSRQLIINENNCESYEYQDGDHLLLKANTRGQWKNIGTYNERIPIAEYRLMDLWLEYQSQGLQPRLRVFIHPVSGDGKSGDMHIIECDSTKDQRIPIAVSNQPRVVSVTLEVKGKGTLSLSSLHYRWSRSGIGKFLPGGKLLQNPQTREQVAYLFNPGDLRPPLNVYFAGARGLEGFEAVHLFRSVHAPSLLFTDTRLEIGQFYAGSFWEQQIVSTIRKTLKRLGFTSQQLVLNGISMGTYPALKIGSILKPYAINVAKPITNLGYLASRARLQRPEDFTAIFDIDLRLLGDLTHEHLVEMDKKFWDRFNRADLKQTRLFIGYMLNDNYDDRTIEKLKKSKAVQQCRQFSYKGFPGRHNDNPYVVLWFVSRVKYLSKISFKREGS